jgi:hypothetical protein
MPNPDFKAILSFEGNQAKLSKLSIGGLLGIGQHSHFHLDPNSILNPTLDAEITQAMVNVNRKCMAKGQIPLGL